MDTEEAKACVACGGVVDNGVCVKCSTKTEDSTADQKDENLHGGTVAEGTPSMSTQDMGEDISAPKSDQEA